MQRPLVYQLSLGEQSLLERSCSITKISIIYGEDFQFTMPFLLLLPYSRGPSLEVEAKSIEHSVLRLAKPFGTEDRFCQASPFDTF